MSFLSDTAVTRYIVMHRFQMSSETNATTDPGGMRYNPRRMIRYLDTRGLSDRPRTFTEAILEGIAPGGGLFVPERLPRFQVEEIVALAALPYRERAARVYEAFGLDVSPARTREIATAAYGDNFDAPGVAPVREAAPGRFVLELWHGPTLAFKDMALQCMPLFFSQALEHEAPRGGFAHRGDARVVEVVAIGRGGDLTRSGWGDVEAEGLVDPRRALAVRQRRQPDDVLYLEPRQPLGHEQAAAWGDALEDGLGKRARAVAETPGVQVADHAPGIVPHAAGVGRRVCLA